MLRKSDGTVVPHVIARISSIPMDLRLEMTDKSDSNNIKLKSEWYGKCASLDGQDISARSKRLMHAVLVNWRPDRSSDSCVIDESFLDSMVL